MLLKTIPLYPTLFSVDVWISNDKKRLCDKFNKRYGASKEYYDEYLMPNQVCVITGTVKSELSREQRIVMNLSHIEHDTVAHECSHVIFHLAKITGIETDYNSQEWFAYMIGYLVKNILDKKTYTKL